MNDKIRKVTSRSTGVVVEVGADRVTSIELVGALGQAYVHKEDDGLDPCNRYVMIDLRYAFVEYFE